MVSAYITGIIFRLLQTPCDPLVLSLLFPSDGNKALKCCTKGAKGSWGLRKAIRRGEIKCGFLL